MGAQAGGAAVAASGAFIAAMIAAIMCGCLFGCWLGKQKVGGKKIDDWLAEGIFLATSTTLTTAQTSGTSTPGRGPPGTWPTSATTA